MQQKLTLRADRKGSQQAPPSQVFTFIDHVDIANPDARRVIRSQVMRGKNARRVLPPRGQPKPRKPADGADAELRIMPYEPAGGGDTEMRIVPYEPHKPREVSVSVSVSGPARPIGLGLLGVLHADKMTHQDVADSYSHLVKYIKYFYPNTVCAPQHDDVQWFELFFQQEAFFHAWVVMSQAVVPGHVLDARGYAHMVDALRLVNGSISAQKPVVSIDTVSCVLMLGCIYMTSGSPRQARLHFAGLARMVHLRGGWRDLPQDSYIKLKCQMFDIALVFHLGDEPRFMTELKLVEDMVPDFDRSIHFKSPLLIMLVFCPVDLHDAALELFRLAHVFNTRSRRNRFSTHKYMESTVNVRYRLLKMYMAGDSIFTDPVSRALHLGLLANSMSLDAFFNPFDVACEPFFSILLAAVDDPTFQSVVDPGTHLWLLMSAVVSVAGPQSRVELAPRVLRAALACEVAEWTSAREVLAAFPWVGGMNDRAASAFWRAVFDTQCLDESKPRMIKH